jgi:hypothetical protein
MQQQKGLALAQTRKRWWGPRRQNSLMKQTQHLPTLGRLPLCVSCAC